MTTIPIIFAIDDNVVVPCGVTITSLLMNARQDTFYDIYILCEKEALPESSRKKIEAAFAANSNCHVGFLDPDGALVPNALEVMVNQHDHHPGCSLIYSTAYLY